MEMVPAMEREDYCVEDKPRVLVRVRTIDCMLCVNPELEVGCGYVRNQESGIRDVLAFQIIYI